jgi:methyl-accepting chemotaxis protein
MFDWTRNVPLPLRFFFVFAWATVIPIIVIGVLSASYLATLQTGSQAVQTSNQAIKITTNELANLQSMHALLVALLPSITSHGTSTHSFQAEQQVIFQVLTIEGNFDIDSVQYQQKYQLATSDSAADIRPLLFNNDPHTTLIAQQQQLLDMVLLHQWPQYKVAQDSLLIALDTQLPLAQAAILLQKADTLYTPVLQSWQNIVAMAEQVNTEVVKVGPTQINPIILGTILAVVTSMLVVFVIGFLVNRTITRPLYQLVTLTRRIINGETTARSDLRGTDEVARVATSMNAMLDHIVRLMQEARDRRDYLGQRVEKLGAEVKGVGEGDLRVRAEVTGDAPGVLAGSFNRVIDELGGLVVRVKHDALDVERSSNAMLQQNTYLVKVGNTQLQQIFLLNADVERMAEASQVIALHAQSLYSIAHNTHWNASGGRQDVLRAFDEINTINQSVQEVAQKVQRLGEVSQEINNIVEVISNIAYQTNRLALDSAIQSATSGEYGKGFGVLAGSIRKLAEQTKNQTTVITHIVRDVLEDIAEVATSMHHTEREAFVGTNAIRDVGEALTVIFAVVERQAKEAVSINEQAGKQLYSANMVVRSMRSTSDTTRDNNAQMNNAALHIQQLMRLVALLSSSVVVFKLRTDLSDPGISVPLTPRRGKVVDPAYTSPLRNRSLEREKQRYTPVPEQSFPKTPFPAGRDTNANPDLQR